MSEKQEFQLSFGNQIGSSEKFNATGLISPVENIPITDLSTGTKLLITQTSDFIDFTIGGFSISELQKIKLNGFYSGNISKRTKNDIKSRIIKILTGKNIYLIILHQMFSKTLPSYILHMLKKTGVSNVDDIYNGKYIILRECNFQNQSKGLTIGEKTIGSLEDGGFGINFDGNSQCIIKV